MEVKFGILEPGLLSSELALIGIPDTLLVLPACLGVPPVGEARTRLELILYRSMRDSWHVWVRVASFPGRFFS